jgi:hypothetical protein
MKIRSIWLAAQHTTHPCFHPPSQPLRSALKMGGQQLAMQIIALEPRLIEGTHLTDTFRDEVKFGAFGLALKMLQTLKISRKALEDVSNMMNGNESGILQERVDFKQELQTIYEQTLSWNNS